MAAMDDAEKTENLDIPEEEKEDNEDPTVCDICLDGEVYENNEIIFCDSCDVAVHQLCYGVKKIPEGSWFCYVCSKGLKPSEVTCELCSFKGGAYKPIDKKGKWTHGLCAMWIPELYEQHSSSEPPTWQFQHLDKRRYNLKCSLCKTKGACVQCSYGRCTTAVHPWCALKNPQGFTRRIIKDEDGEPHWEIFCKQHAKAVSDPVKKSSKNKHQSNSSAALFEDDGQEWEDSESKPVNTQGRRQSAVAEAASTAHALPHHGFSMNLVDDVDHVAHISLKDEEEDAAGGENDSDEDEKPSGLAGALQEQSATSFPTLSLLEWPGLSEGDGMDLDHFWNFTSSFFAEDHTREWYQFMKHGARQTLPKHNDEAMVLQFSTALKSASTKEELEELLEEVNESFSNERNRSSALYYDKRNRYLDDVERTLDILAACAANDHNLRNTLSTEQSKADDGDKDEQPDSNNATSIALAAAKSKLFAYYQHKRFSYDDEHAFLPDESSVVSKQQYQSSAKEIDSPDMKVVFDGSTRFGATFSLIPRQDVSFPEDLLDLNSAEKFLFPKPTHLQADGSSDAEVSLMLKSFEPIPYDKKLVVNGKTVLAKDDISILQRLILTDYHAYSELVHNIRSRLERAIQAAEAENIAGKEVDLYEQSKEVHMAYVKQQVWKWVCSSMHNGVCDQKSGAYKFEEELPASWTIQVPGRPAAPAKDEQSEEKESHEDIVCMCCFDGSFAEDRNQILFCDGCNATVHQKCYGIAEIPEGQFYCDRCSYIQRQYHEDDVDPNFLKNAVRCCLCPLYHGGLKKTTDKRWVHMCCALFASGHTAIHNLTKMTHIDISEVPMQNQGRPLIIPKVTSTSSRFNVHPDACIYCHAYGGYVVSCQHGQKQGEDDADTTTAPCNTKFHPICAWFAGGYIRSEISDPSFQGKDRHGLFPSGLNFSYLCAQHDQEARNQQAETIRTEQITIRSKYRINELDLTVMPGKNNKRKHRRQNKKNQSERAQNGGTGRGATAASQVQKELAPDVYTDKLCAICMKPTTDDLFGSGYDSQVMSAITLEYDHVEKETAAEAATDIIMAVDNPTAIEGIKTEADAAGEEVNVATVTEIPVKEEKGVTSSSGCEEPPTTPIKAADSASSADAIEKTAPYTPMRTAQRVLFCQQCGINVHFGCLKEVAPSVAQTCQDPATNTPWLCTLCATHSDVSTMDCALCPRHGGIFCPTIENTMVHPYCAKTMSTQVVVAASTTTNAVSEETGNTPHHVDEDLLELRQYVKDANRKQKCGICNRKKGLCLPCSEVGCQVYFHPLCGLRSGKGYVRHKSATVREAFCQEHIPPGIELSSTGFWIDGYELGHMRRSMDRARIILDMVIKREKFKKMICKTELDLFTHRFQKAFAKAVGKKITTNTVDEQLMTLEAMESDMSDYFSGDDDEDEINEEIDAQFQATHGDKFVLLTDFPQTGKKLELVPFTNPKTGDVVYISPTWTKFGEIRRPKNLRIAFAGYQLFPRDLMGMNVKPYVKLHLEKIHRHADEIRVYSGIFTNRKEEEQFGKKLHQDLTSQWQMSDKEFIEHLQTLGATWVDIPRVGVSRRSSTTTTTKQQAQTPANNKRRPRRKNEDDDELEEDDDDDLDNPDTADENTGKSSRKRKTKEQETQKKTPGRKKRQVQEDDSDQDTETHKEEEDEDNDHRKKKLRLSLPSTAATGKKRKQEDLAMDVDDDNVDVEHSRHHPMDHKQRQRLAAHYREELQSIRTSGTYQEFVKHFHNVGVSVNNQAVASKKRHTTTSSAATSFDTIFATSLETTSSPHKDSDLPFFLSIGSELDLSSLNNNDQFVFLERVLFQVLDNLGQIEDTHPETLALIAQEKAERAMASSPTKKKKQPQQKQKKNAKQKANKSNNVIDHEEEDKYMLVEEYEEIPYDDLPQYDEYVRRAVSLQHIRDTLQSHGYRSLASFVSDFYALMNNARHVATMANIKIRDNTKRLCELFSRFLHEALQYHCTISSSNSNSTAKLLGMPLRYDPVYGGQRLQQIPLTNSRSRSSTATQPHNDDTNQKNITVHMRCSHCAEEWEVRHWPEAFQIPTHLLVQHTNEQGVSTPAASSNNRRQSHKAAAQESLGRWFCQRCVSDVDLAVSLTAKAVGAEENKVRVWWRGDGCAYLGQLLTWETQAQAHQILYEDEEWEFVNLAWEPYLFA